MQREISTVGKPKRRENRTVARVHGRYFGSIRPANTLIEISDLVGEYDVEIEAEAIVDSNE